MISVVIPFYNNSHSIQRCLESVLAQTFKDIEVLLINDCSPDWNKAESIINSFDDLPILVIHHEVNKNGAVARNTGINKASGDYIAFMDADDEWEQNHLQNLKNAIDKDNDVYFSSCRVLSKSEYVLPKHDIKSSNSIGEFLFCENGFIQTSSIMIKSTLAKKCLFNEKLRRHQDYDFLLRLEDIGANFKWCKPVTTIVHWETNDIDKKGGTWQFSLEWFEEYKKYLTTKAQTYFIYKNVVVRLLKNKERVKALKILNAFCKLKHLNKKDLVFFISYLIFGKIVAPRWGK